ncbi:MAG: hypothetical protein NTV45_02880, partial [Firmicutes bacterium]|nr:hypothetical protein [Bacillota bacterium]
MINILVTAVGRGAGQAVIKSLRQSDLDIRIIGTDSDPWATGLYAADKSYLCPMCSDPNFIPKILDICRREGIKLIIPNIDPELIVFAENKSEFKAIGVTVLISDPGTIKICRNKLDTYRFFQAKNLPFVETRLFIDMINHPEMTFPMFIKPIGVTGSSVIDILFRSAYLAKYA